MIWLAILTAIVFLVIEAFGGVLFDECLNRIIEHFAANEKKKKLN